jgi:fermentation-respiration switch protein FrsA (DUF1100 family)
MRFNSQSAFSDLIRVRTYLRRIVLSLLVIIYAVFVGCSHVSIRPINFFFKHTKQFTDRPDVRQYSPQDVCFKSADGLTLHGWYFRAKEEKGTILICHGYFENISMHAEHDLWLIDAGYNVFIFDYRGYGKSHGTPDIDGVHLDTEAALEWLVFKLPRAQQGGIIVFGESLGGAIAVYAVAKSQYKSRVEALILDSTFSSYRQIAREMIGDSIIGWPFQYPLSFLVSDEYSPVKFIKNVSPVPVVIIHGTNDKSAPIYHGRALYDAALQPKRFWVSMTPGHLVAYVDEKIKKKLLAFLESLPASP